MELKRDKKTEILEIKQVVEGVEYKKKFFGYTDKEAIKLFNKYIKKKSG